MNTNGEALVNPDSQVSSSGSPCASPSFSSSLSTISGDEISHSPATNTPLIFKKDEEDLLKKCWLAGVMAVREDKHLLTGSWGNTDEGHILLQRCFLHGMMAKESLHQRPGAALTKAFMAGLFADGVNNQRK